MYVDPEVVCIVLFIHYLNKISSFLKKKKRVIESRDVEQTQIYMETLVNREKPRC